MIIKLLMKNRPITSNIDLNLALFIERCRGYEGDYEQFDQ